MLFENFKQGLNLGGFLSQYELIADAGSKEALQQHFETFITEDNIKQIASWGFDHVRIPVDGWLFLDKEKKILRENRWSIWIVVLAGVLITACML